MTQTETFTVEPKEEGIRIDQLLYSRFPTHSRTYFQQLIAQGHVLLNGAIPKKRALVKAKDAIAVHFVLPKESEVEGEAIPLEILYEDDVCIAVNKPAGMVVHPAPGNWTGTFVNALLFHCKELQDGSLRPGIVHRLDKGTTGVLVAAKTGEAQKNLKEQFAFRQVEKEYLAICIGNPGTGEIEAPIGRHPKFRKEMMIRKEGGRIAKSTFMTQAFDGTFSFVKVKLLTGRTHQIRVHLKARGTPILGDLVYGSSSINKKWSLSFPLLHAWRLGFYHPKSKEWIEVTVPPPPLFQKWVDTILSTAKEKAI